MTKQEETFIKTVWAYYAKNGRHTLPWRKTHKAYDILVSEMMLQQTQVERVLPKYQAFIKKFPTVQKLSKASLGEVLVLWQGLGYNRRAKMLLLCAQKVVAEYKGIFPQTESELIKLPGIGSYTASAIMAFAFNTPISLIETNVRSVYIHHFFKEQEEVADTDIMKRIERTRSINRSREWYYALMDYGSSIKKEFGNPNKKSAHHTVQSKFEGSDRQVRGAIVRALAQRKCTRKELLSQLHSFEDIIVDAQVEKLLQEGMIIIQNKIYSLPV